MYVTCRLYDVLPLRFHENTIYARLPVRSFIIVFGHMYGSVLEAYRNSWSVSVLHTPTVYTSTIVLLCVAVTSCCIDEDLAVIGDGEGTVIVWRILCGEAVKLLQAATQDVVSFSHQFSCQSSDTTNMSSVIIIKH